MKSEEEKLKKKKRREEKTGREEKREKRRESRHCGREGSRNMNASREVADGSVTYVCGECSQENKSKSWEALVFLKEGIAQLLSLSLFSKLLFDQMISRH